MEITQRVTLRNVAQRAGVSTAAVSGVLTDNRHIKISQPTRDRIIQAVRATGYKRRLVNPRNRKKSPLTILVFSRWAPEQPHASIRLKAIELPLLEHGGRMIVYTTDQAHALITSGKFSLLDGVTGAIFLSRVDRMCVEMMRTRNIPVVVIGSGEYYDDIDMVYTDPLGYPRVAVRYLQSLGHRRIGVVLGPFPHFSYEVSWMAYKDYLARIMGKSYASYLRMAMNEEGGKYTEIQKLLSMKNRPTAITGQCANGILIAEQLGLKVPEDVSFLTYDTPGTWESHPLSYVGSDENAIGRQAVELLLARKQHPDETARHIIFPVSMHDHGSCARVDEKDNKQGILAVSERPTRREKAEVLVQQ